MLSKLFRQINPKYRQLYKDPVISSCLFSSLTQFQQQFILRMITTGQMKHKEIKKIINEYFSQAERMLEQTKIVLENLGVLEYINEQKTYKLNKKFCESLEEQIMKPKSIPFEKLMLSQEQEEVFEFKDPLIYILYDASLENILFHCDLKYVNYKSSQLGQNLQAKNFEFLRASNAKKISILIKGLLKSSGDITTLREIIYISTLVPREFYKIDRFNKNLISILENLKIVKTFRNTYFTINSQINKLSSPLDSYRFENENENEQKSQHITGRIRQDLKIRVIIETNYKVYIIKNTKKPDNQSQNHDHESRIIRSIMKDLIELEHEEYDFDGMFVGSITLEKMKSIFQQRIEATDFISFFEDYMLESVEANKDLGKWKKLKFLGAQGPSSEDKTPSSVKQQILLWESQFKYNGLDDDEDIMSEEDN